MRRPIVYALVLVCIAWTVTLAGCGEGDDASREDAHDVRGDLIDKSRPHIIAMNNKFPNVSTKCLGAPPKDVDGAPQGERQPNDTAAAGGGWRVVVTTSKSIALVQDAKCPGFVKGSNLPPVVIPSP
jgi:hypothetical protein